MMQKTSPSELAPFASGQLPSTPPTTPNSADKTAIQLSILTQFYPPDFAATGQLIEELAQNLRSPNFHVRVFTGQPGYAYSKTNAPAIEQSDYLNVKRSQTGRLFPNRIRGKALNGVLFFLRSVLHLCKAANRGDVLLITTAPPFLPLVGYLIHFLFGTPYVCLLYDLYPDIAVELNVVSGNHWIVKFWDGVNYRVWQKAARIIVLSSTMQERIIGKYPEGAAKIAVIHNWADPEFIVPIPKIRNWFALKHKLVEPFTVLYSGNMGRCHDLETIIEAAYQLRDEPVRFVFIGGGAKRPICLEKIRSAGLTNCQFLPYQDKDNLPYSLTACDLSIVSIRTGMEGLVVPSKLYSALASGRPIAALCEGHSYLRSLIDKAGCGAVFYPGDSTQLAEFIRQLARDRYHSKQLGRAGRHYMQARFTPQIIAKAYTATVHQGIIDSAYKAIDTELGRA
jgi:glycosyltransferase involved in cell wall biosynthesis